MKGDPAPYTGGIMPMKDILRFDECLRNEESLKKEATKEIPPCPTCISPVYYGAGGFIIGVLTTALIVSALKK